MATTARASLQPNNEAARPSAKGRTTAMFVNHDASTDNALTPRMQRLRRLGVLGQRASLIASLAWGEVHQC